MGRITVLLATVSLFAIGGQSFAQENIRQVAPGITMAPGLPKPAQAKKAETATVETSKSQNTTYGDPVSPAPAGPLLEAKVEPPKPSQPPMAVNAKPEPDPHAVSRPVAASPAAVPQQPAPAAQAIESEKKIATAPREQLRPVSQQQPRQAAREPRIGDRIADDARLYPAQRVRVGDRVPDNLPLYDLPRTAVR